MNQELFRRFSEMAYECAGIHLREGKEHLVEARVAKRLRALNLPTPEAYLHYLETHRDTELVHFLDAISTNYTSFFREADHFDTLAEVVERRLRSGAKRLRFWSAASSSGEEPYSMAIVVDEVIGDRNVDWRILATDISTKVLAHAREGVYPTTGLSPLEPARLSRNFTAVGADHYQVNAELRSHIVFKRLNLAAPPFPMPGPLDAVFCRNVMIYFDLSVRQPLITSIEGLLGTEGVLAIGHSESLSGIRTQLHAVRPSVYIKSMEPRRHQRRSQLAA